MGVAGCTEPLSSSITSLNNLLAVAKECHLFVKLFIKVIVVVISAWLSHSPSSNDHGTLDAVHPGMIKQLQHSTVQFCYKNHINQWLRCSCVHYIWDLAK